METFNGAIPGPTLRLNVGDTVIVRLINLLDHPTGIHWHGIELANSADGTEVTQDGVLPAFPAPPAAPAPAGGTYLYKFKVPRPGLYWYHPHHHLATNRVFRGLYGMIVVTDPNEAALIASGAIPGPADTRQLVLSDITVCKAPGTNDTATYVDPTTVASADAAEWLSGARRRPAPPRRPLRGQRRPRRTRRTTTALLRRSPTPPAMFRASSGRPGGSTRGRRCSPTA